MLSCQEWSAQVGEVVSAIKEGAEVGRIEMLLSRAPAGIIHWAFDDNCDADHGEHDSDYGEHDPDYGEYDPDYGEYDTLLTMAIEASRFDVARLLLERFRGRKNKQGALAVEKELVKAVEAGQVSGTGPMSTSYAA